MSSGFVVQTRRTKPESVIFSSFQCKPGSSVVFRECGVVKGRFAVINHRQSSRFTWVLIILPVDRQLQLYYVQQSVT